MDAVSLAFAGVCTVTLGCLAVAGNAYANNPNYPVKRNPQPEKLRELELDGVGR